MDRIEDLVKTMSSAQIQPGSLAPFSRCRVPLNQIQRVWRKIEDAQDPDVSEVTTREVPEDDVPAEYRDNGDEHVA